MIYGHFRVMGAFEAVQDQSDPFNIRLQNDDVQDFDRRPSSTIAAKMITVTGPLFSNYYKKKT